MENPWIYDEEDVKDNYWVIDKSTGKFVEFQLQKKFKKFDNLISDLGLIYFSFSTRMYFNEYINYDTSKYKVEFLYLYFSIIDQIALDKTNNKNLAEHTMKNKIQYLQAISPTPIDDKITNEITRFLYNLISIVHPDFDCLFLPLFKLNLTQCDANIDFFSEEDVHTLEILGNIKRNATTYINWLKKGNTGIAAEIDKIIEKTNYRRIIDIKTHYLRVQDIFPALQHMDEKDLNVLDRFLSYLIINTPGDEVERNKQLKKLKQQIEHCKQTHKQNNTPVLTIQNAQQVIDNQNGTITIKK